MDFFEKVGDTFSSKSKEVAKKAKSIAEISNLNGQINSQEKTIDIMYVELGKAYFEQNKDNADDKYAEQCNIIKEAAEKIKTLNDEINKIKGNKVCIGCGAVMDADTLFCPKCGTKNVPVEPEVVEEEEPVINKCPECGTDIKADSKFCAVCGHKLQ